MSIKREIKHRKFITNGKLYDTEKSEGLLSFKDNYVDKSDDSRILFKTEKGNYFSAILDEWRYINCDYEKILEYTYYDMRIETAERAKELIGLYNFEKYIELFGEVEEA